MVEVPPAIKPINTAVAVPGYAFDIVMLGQPVAFVSPPFYMPGQIQTVLHGLAWGAIHIHHYQIKNRQWNAQFFFRMLHPGSYQSDAFILQQMLPLSAIE